MAGGFDASVDGIEQFAELKRDFKAAGTKQLKTELLAAGRRLDRKVTTAVRAHAVSDLPRAGGLNVYTSKRLQFTTTSQVSAKGFRFRFTTIGKVDIRALNSGALRHPVYGNTDRWVKQNIRPGFVDRALDEMSEDIRAEFLQAVDAALRTLR